MIIKGADGRKAWLELSNFVLPKGGRKLTFVSGFLVSFGIVTAAFGYTHFQSTVNPEGWFGRFYEKFITNPLGAFEADNHPLHNIGNETKP